MYTIIETKTVPNYETIMYRVKIAVDTAEDIPVPLDEWAVGSEMEVYENGGSRYKLGTDGEWHPVNFKKGSGGGDNSEVADQVNQNTSSISLLTGRVSRIETNIGGHTVKSDVPENAVFTDTVYDDSEVKEDISSTKNRTTTLENNLGDHTVKSDVPENAVFTDTVYDDSEVKEDVTSINNRTTSLENKLGDHTVKSDVPENAVFTDTVYDDTEVKEDISLVDMRVSQLENSTDKTDYTRYGLPILYLTGSTDGMTKENPVTLNYMCTDKDGIVKEGTCTLKWQGSSSLAYEKKNYTIKFDSELEAVDGWSAQKKYCLKANFIDHSHARNLVCAKLWGQIVKSRAKTNTRLNALPNAGAVDGFPIIIMLNDEFHGLYTWNIPKDAWMFGMGSGTHEAIVCADVPLNEGAVAFKVLADFENDFELEYSSFDEAEVLSSLNRLIQAVIDSNGADLDTTIANYLDWDSAIDYYIFTVLITGLDNTKKNYILATYDGEKWFYSAYDMDSTFGIDWDGGAFLPADRRPTFSTRTSDNLMKLIWNYKRQRLHDRCEEIMETVFSESNIAIEFSNFIGKIPSPILKKDVELYPTIPCSSVNNTSQIFNYYRMRFAYALKWIEKMLDGYAGDVESGITVTNVVPLSVDESGNVYNGTGYKDGYRLNSSGTEREQASSCVTGFIRCTKNDIIRLTGVKFAAYGATGSDGTIGGNGVGNLYSYLSIYNSNKVLIHSINCDYILTSHNHGLKVSGWSYPIAQDTDIITFDFSDYEGEDMTYIRINAVGQGAKMIVTINEEIA